MSKITLRHGFTPFEIRGWRHLGQALADTKVQPIAALEPGLVQIEGWVRSLETLEEPRNHEQVIGYRMVVDGLDAGGSSFFVTHIWRLLFDASEVENFIVEDQSGSIRVDASDALFLLDYQSLDEGRIYDGLAGGLIDFWERYGLSSTTVATVRKLRLLECLLRPDTGVFVFGVASAGDRTVPGTGTYRDAPRPELSIGPFPSRGVVISDRKRADVINYIVSPQGKLLLPRASYNPTF
jgi:hypothetical protein